MGKLRNWLSVQSLRLGALLNDENGLETLEWVALAAVFAVLIMLIMTVAQGAGTGIGSAIFNGILNWASKIGGG